MIDAEDYEERKSEDARHLALGRFVDNHFFQLETALMTVRDAWSDVRDDPEQPSVIQGLAREQVQTWESTRDMLRDLYNR